MMAITRSFCLRRGNGNGFVDSPRPCVPFGMIFSEAGERVCGSQKASLAGMMPAGNRLSSAGGSAVPARKGVDCQIAQCLTQFFLSHAGKPRAAGQTRLARPDSTTKIYSPQTAHTLDCVLPPSPPLGVPFSPQR